MKSDWVSLKVDSTEEETWRRINWSHRTLQLASILEGTLEFAKAYRGELATETMLVEGVNDSDNHIRRVSEFLASLRPGKAYLSIPTRPPAEEWVRPPSEEVLNRAYQMLSKRVGQVEYLIGYEGNAFASTGNVEDDLLDITAVHPMREQAVRELLARAGADWSVVRKLIAQGQLIDIGYEGKRFYTRRIRLRKV